MDAFGPTPIPPTDAVTPPGETPPGDAPSTPPGFPRRLWAYGLIAGLAAGLVGWACGEATLDHYRPSKEAASQPYAFKQLNLEKDYADGLNAAIAFGSLGAATGLGLGLLGGWSRKSVRGAVLGGIAGIVLGAVAGAATSPLVVPLFRKYYEPHSPDLKLPILVHGAIWCALGLGAGLAFGIGQGDRRRILPAAIGGLLGAALATLLFDSVGAVFFPFSEADMPISPAMFLRFLARLLVAIGVVLGTLWAVRTAPTRKSRPNVAIGEV